MQKIIFILIALFSFAPVLALSQGVVEEEAKGRSIWENIRDKKVSCAELADGDFELLGDYFMGQMSGASHEVMDQMMSQMMGQANVDLMHIAMGKRLSGCDASAVFPQSGTGFMPMMQMMSGGMMGGFNNWAGIRGGNSVWMAAGWIILALFWIAVILGLIVLIKWLIGQIKR